MSSNTLDSIRHGSYVGSSKGSYNTNAKLTENDVIVIRKLLSEGHLTQTDIGDMFEISDTIINRINKGKAWTHVV